MSSGRPRPSCRPARSGWGASAIGLFALVGATDRLADTGRQRTATGVLLFLGLAVFATA
ncbi:hypothetical protein AB5J72_29700 [Streptomyces sp. CG1]|uniref:hypothetical protein n=1 Tax=Streptomyces sp. CG1 TaxID=1287523 RepID=UPI0034E2A008